MWLNYDQRKHLASVIDKAAIAYFAVVGYTSYTKGDWLMFVHALVAFAGIGRPEKFFETLRQTGALLAASHAFADHHVYTNAELEFLRAEARSASALLVATAKDHVRMGAPSDVHVLDVALAPDEPGDLEDLLAQGLARARRR